MHTESRPDIRWRIIIFSSIGSLLLIVDQLTKAWIRDNLERGEVLFDVGVFQVLRSQNTGVIFGLFKDHLFTIKILACIGIVLIVALFFLYYKRWPFLQGKLVQTSLLLLFCGTIGNQIDRFWLGFVTDFIDFKFWPVFNIADSMTTIGGILMVYAIIFHLKLPEKKE